MLKVLHLRVLPVKVPLAKARQARARQVRNLPPRVLPAVLNPVPLAAVQVPLQKKAEHLHPLEVSNPEILAVEVKGHLAPHQIAVQALGDSNLEASQIQRIKVPAVIIAVAQRKSLPMIAVQAQGEALADPSFQIHFIGAGPIMEEEVDFLLELC